MNADLHFHSTYSDGSLTIREILIAARGCGLDAVSVTDHDTTAGTAEALALEQKTGLTVFPGIEVSAFDFKRSRKVHLLGYNYREPAVALETLCGPLLRRRQENSLRQIDILVKAGFDISPDEAQAVAGNGRTIYKQHIMAVLVAKGYAHAVDSQLYRALFNTGGICAGDIDYCDVFEALDAIRSDGGLAVLAHPGQLNSWDIVDSLVACGLAGIEYYHESHNTDDYKKAADIIHRHPQLVLTGGSDGHGVFGSGRHGVGDIRAPSSFPGFTRRLPDELADAAAAIVKEAGVKLRRALLDEPEAHLKNGDCHDVVTAYDLATEEFLIARLTNLVPGSTAVSEETPGEDDGRGGSVWIIDPIDGTINFLVAKKDFAVSVALYENGRARFGVVYDVAGDELFVGIAGKGAFCNGVPIQPARGARRLAEAVIDFSLHTLTRLREDRETALEELSPLIRHRSSGCASLNLCRIAQGKLDAYCAARIRIWDYAAAVVVLEESGGKLAALVDGSDKDGRGPRFCLAAGSRDLFTELQPLCFPEGAAGPAGRTEDVFADRIS
jgi:fructose-1,6-bisphosphatase/inositol monophosphatase family enzyme/predicted metal-dependent phosphoesterase TrpH